MSNYEKFQFDSSKMNYLNNAKKVVKNMLIIMKDWLDPDELIQFDVPFPIMQICKKVNVSMFSKNYMKLTL